MICKMTLHVISHAVHSNTLLGGRLEHVSFFHSVENVIIPIDGLIFLRGLGQPPIRLHRSNLQICLSQVVAMNQVYRAQTVAFHQAWI